MNMEEKITFHRFYGPRSCRIEAQPTAQRWNIPDATTWSLLVVGDYIPTVDDQRVNIEDLYAEADKILSAWAAIAKTRL